MKRVTGISGIFFKAKDPESLKAWYREHLGITAGADGSVIFPWRDSEQPELRSYTVWAPFPVSTRYFDPSRSSFMINYRVENLDRLLEQLRREDVEVDERVEEYRYGRFSWVMDLEGNRIELWEPPEKEE